MTRSQLPATPETTQRARRAPIVVALLVALVLFAVVLLHPNTRTALGESLSRAPQSAAPIAASMVPDQLPMPPPEISPNAIDARKCAGNRECDPAYYEPGAR
jgi:hypothetical protein